MTSQPPAAKLSALSQALLMLLPIAAAALTTVICRVFLHAVSDAVVVAQITLLTLIAYLPFFAGHYFSFRMSLWRAAMVWLACFVAYPLLLVTLQPSLAWPLADELGTQSFTFAIIASLGHIISRQIQQRNSNKASQWMARLLSLNTVMALLLTIWATLFAGIFVSTVDPMNNQPLMLVIRSDRLFDNLGLFADYWAQFMTLALLVAVIYWVNRYVLIRKLLAPWGVFLFVTGTIVSIAVLTPLLASIALLLPLNQGEFTLIPSGNHNLFDPLNFNVCFAMFAVFTPVILAFERQQQSTIIEATAKRQALIELKMLQQQMNPHFLFNTLNNLYALTLKKSELAPELVMKLANLLRYSVYEGQKPLVNLSSEIGYLQDYLALQRIRLGNGCRFHLQWPEHADNWQLPPLMLIVLTENAFKHGIERTHASCDFSLRIDIEDQHLLMTCENTLATGAADGTSGIGLENLRRRLALVFGDNYSLVSETKENCWHASLKMGLTPC